MSSRWRSGRGFRPPGPRAPIPDLQRRRALLGGDLAEIVASAYEHCRPLAITIPTNGLLGDRIAETCDRIAAACPQSNVGINLSLDEVGERHDQIRGVPGNWEKAMGTWAALKQLRRPNLTLSIHTVISRHNVQRLTEIRQALAALEPDSYITEIAEQRRELDTLDSDITPSPEEYRQAVEDLLAAGSVSAGGYALPRPSVYYRLAAEIVEEERQVIPCYAGWASGHFAPTVTSGPAALRGAHRQPQADGLRPAPHMAGEEATRLRRSIRAVSACPMANAAYTNMLLTRRRCCRWPGHLLRR